MKKAKRTAAIRRSDSHLLERPVSPPSKSSRVLSLLQQYESPNVTFIEPDGSWPIVWEKARGNHVWDAEGRKYTDLTAAFGVAAAGHANPRVVRAGQKQMGQLLHAMGDVHPHALKAELARALSRLTFERWLAPKPSRAKAALNLTLSQLVRGKTIFCNSGFEAVEAALKTAFLATGKPGIIAFSGAYHGLGYGALNATQRDHFRLPFRSQIREFGHFVPFPTRTDDLGAVQEQIKAVLRKHPIGAILVEPIQGRGGINIPPPEFLPLLRSLCDQHAVLLIADEVFTGFGRTGAWFACEHFKTVPDLICLGKALTGGFPLSACVGRDKLMDAAWPPSSGEAIHTSTYLGHPVGCAMALAQIAEIERKNLVKRSAAIGDLLLTRLKNVKIPDTLSASARGLGLMTGLELRRADGSPATVVALNIVKTMLHRGYVLLPEAEHANVIAFTPPLTISETDLLKALSALQKALAEH